MRITRDHRIARQHLLVFVVGTEVDLDHREVGLKLLSEVGILFPQGAQTVASISCAASRAGSYWRTAS